MCFEQLGGPQAWRTMHSQLEMALEVVRPGFSWHSELERLMNGHFPFQASVGAFLNSPLFKLPQMTGQLLGYHLASSDPSLRVEAAKHFGSDVKDLATWRRESTTPLLHTLFC